MSQLIDFYRGQGTDSEGRKIAEVWAYSDEQLEDVHDYIQWLFPLRTPSSFNPNAPMLSDAEVAEFRSDPALRANLRRSFEVYLTFLGLGYSEGAISKATDFDGREVFQHPDHNWLRITRVITSTRLLGLEQESRAFFEFLKGVWESGRSGVTADAYRHWHHAALGRAR